MISGHVYVARLANAIIYHGHTTLLASYQQGYQASDGYLTLHVDLRFHN